MNVALPEGRVRSLTRRLDAAPDPLALFSALTNGGPAANAMLLESAEPTSRQTQRSILVISSAVRFVCRRDTVHVTALNRNGRSVLPLLRRALARWKSREIPDGLECRFEPPDPLASEYDRLRADSPLSVLRAVLQQLRPESNHVPHSVLLAGLFAYDLVAQFESLPEIASVVADPSAVVPEYVFMLADQLVVIDHLRQHAEIVVNVFGGDDADAGHHSAAARLGRIAATAQELAAHPPAAPVFSNDMQRMGLDAEVDIDDAAFRAIVAEMQDHIRSGDVFQIVPSRSFLIDCADPLLAYASLRDLNPSPYLFFADFGDFHLLGASPESAVKVDGPGRSVELSPIAGTRARGFGVDGAIDTELDYRLEAELRLDAKENAEHMMLVDLARNDVARVSASGSRHVAELARVVRYSHVMHLVSRVQGTLREDIDALHAYQASMNMGTLTGAPKIKAMQLIRRFERSRRGHYGGAVGYLRGDGSMDTAIVIRAALVRGGKALVRAGAGVVHDSVPQLEADETRRKADAVIRSIARANAAAGAEGKK